MDLAVAELLEEEERKAYERKAAERRKVRAKEMQTDDTEDHKEEDFIKFAKGEEHERFESKYRRPSPNARSKRDLFGGRIGSAANRLSKYEDENDSSTKHQHTSPETPARESSSRQDRRSRDSTHGISDAESANGSARSSRRRSRSPSTGRHSRRDRDQHYRARYDDRHRNNPKYSRHDDYDRGQRAQHEGGEDRNRENRSSNKRRVSEDVDMTDAPPSSRPRHERSPHADRPGSSHQPDRHRRDDRRRDDYYSGSRREDGRHSDHRREDRREPFRKKTPEPADDERDLRTVFCQQLAARLRTRELKEFFEKLVGPVQDAQIVKDRVSGRSKGVGYVEFKDKESIQKALGLTGQKLLGIPIIVTVSDAEKNRQAKANEGMTSANNNGQPFHRLYVGNIQFSITEDDITSLFENFGTLDFVQLQRDEIGRSKGYGFVQFADPKDASAALESMNGQMLNNRPMRVGLGTTDKMAQEANATLQQRQAQSGSSFSGAGGRGGYSSAAKEEANKGAGASALDDSDVSGVSLSNVNRHELMRKLARMDDPNAKTETQQRVTKPAIEKVDPTRCICLTGMWSAKTTATKGWQAETEEDVRQECNEKYGIVKHVGIDPNSQTGEVYVKFDRIQGGENAYRGLNGRYFDGARISAKYVVDTIYNIMFPKASNL